VVGAPSTDDKFTMGRQLEAGLLFDVFEAEGPQGQGAVHVSVIGATWEDTGALLPQVAEEARRAEHLVHPHICAVKHVALEDGRLCVAEESGGESLDSRMQGRGRFPVDEAVAIVTHVCEALAYTHEQGLSHGALTPRCIRLDGHYVKLAGFGVLGAIARTPETSGLARRQRPAFISPEEARGNLPTRASDIYAIGVIFFRLLTGQLPFRSDDPMELARAHCYTPAPRARDIAGDIPQRLDSLLSRALAKDPSARPSSIKSFLGELREQAQQLGAPSPTLPEPSLRRTAADAVRRDAAAAEADLERRPLSPAELAKALSLSFGRYLAGALLITAFALGIVSLLFFWLVSTRHPEVVVPDVTGMASPLATSRLESLGLTMVVADERYSPDGPEGAVIRMIAPYAKKRVRRGRQVRVIVSKGARQVRVPNVADQTVEGATRELQRALLTVATPIAERQHDTVPEGRIISQTPEPGAVVAEGSEVALVRSTGQTRQRVGRDSVSWYRVRITVPAGKRTQRVRIDVAHGDGTVEVAHDQLYLRGHVAEALVRGVGVFTIRVYVDGELAREIQPVRE